jgi:probable biosynthetic protein (TIGR04098 family)
MNFKDYIINMPQMALEALSENWLFKELGDIHWELLCNGLETKSFDVKNDTGDRLYATFVRIRISCSHSLKAFKENEKMSSNASIERFGNSMYFSKIGMTSRNTAINAELMTTFSLRNATDNTHLVKSEPNTSINNVPKLNTLPAFGNEYRLLKKKVLKSIESGNTNFEVNYDTDAIFEIIYQLNPFYDLNGVNLLYFAAYPIINDFCEAQYFNQKNKNIRWEQSFYTAYKDVFYYANCNINDNIVYKLISYEEINSNRVKISSILFRQSDGEILARIFSIKQRL